MTEGVRTNITKQEAATEDQCINALVRARTPIYSKSCDELEAGEWDFGE